MNQEFWHEISTLAKAKNAELIAVSKTKSAAEIMELYNLGQRAFGENKVQELTEKQSRLPADIQWHLIGHLQTNKVKYAAPFVHMIHSVDSLKLLAEINKQAERNKRVIPCLLQMHIADEESKFGLDKLEAVELLQNRNLKNFPHVRIEGLMGMATNTNDEQKIRTEFTGLKAFFDELKNSFFVNNKAFKTLSMGMSSDYAIALECGSNMIRIGSLLFGNRT